MVCRRCWQLVQPTTVYFTQLGRIKGGVGRIATVFSHNYSCVKASSGSFPPFECIAFTLKAEAVVLRIRGYRSPELLTSVLSEFSDLMQLIMTYNRHLDTTAGLPFADLINSLYQNIFELSWSWNGRCLHESLHNPRKRFLVKAKPRMNEDIRALMQSRWKAWRKHGGKPRLMHRSILKKKFHV